MRNFLLSCALAAVAVVPALAEDAYFGYCSEYLTGLGNGQANIWCAEAIRLTQEDMAMYGEGAQLKGINFGYAQSSNMSVTVFVSRNLGEAPLFTKTITAEGVYTFNTVTFDTPVDLDGSDIYIGYYTKTLTARDYPLGFDGEATFNPNAVYVALSQTENGIWSAWQTVDQFGNASIYALIDTPNEIAAVSLSGSNFPTFAAPDKEFDGTVTVQNLGNTTVTSVTANYKIGQDEVISKEYTCDPIAPGQSGTISLTGLKASNLGKAQEIIVNITGVNGGLNMYPTAVYNSEIDIIAEWYEQVVVIEEGTGTGCGYCPRGYVGMEYMKDTYKDGTYYGICAHEYNKDDPMYCASYAPAVSTIFRNSNGQVGFPCATVNRIQVFDPSKENCELIYESLRRFYSEQKIEIAKVLYTPGYEAVRVSCNVEALDNIGSHRFGIALVTTEDEVGPYAQANSFSGGQAGPLEGFDNKGRYVNLVFNDVAREIASWRGNTSVVPKSITAKTPTACDPMDIALTGVQKVENSSVTALLIDTTSGQIISAHRVSLPAKTDENVDWAGIEGIANDVEGVEYFTLDGLRVNSDKVAPGLYIKRAGGETTKVLVK